MSITLNEIKTSRWEARQKWLEYRRAVKARHTAEDELLRRAYRELSLGKRVVELWDTVRAGGLDQYGRPKLAICRADAKMCHLLRIGTWAKFSADRASQYADGRSSEAKHRQLYITPNNLLPAIAGAVRARAVLPTIPPWARPARGLDKFCILWEAEWERVPVDPILLQPIGGSLFLVLAQWDLTPLERAVLGPRMFTLS